MRIEVGSFIQPRPMHGDLTPEELRRNWLMPEYVLRMNRAAERADYDFVLCAYAANAHDPWSVASFGADHTTRLRQLIAHRPGVMAPTLAARMVSTLDVLSGGRIALNIICGGHQNDQERDGDFLDHDARYARAEEYLDLMKRVWTSEEPFHFEGDFYRALDVSNVVKPWQRPHPPIYVGGASEPAMRLAARHADVYMLWGEPVAGVQERFEQVRRVAYAQGRTLRFNVSFRTVIGRTEAEAWRTVEQMLDGLDLSQGERMIANSQSVGQQRLYQWATSAEVLDERLYTGFARLFGGIGNTTALVGTVDQIVESLARYIRLGVDSFTLRGFFEEENAPEFRAGLVQALRRAGREIAAEQTAGAA